MLYELAKQALQRLEKKILIDGALTASTSPSFAITNPAKNEVIGQMPSCSAEEVDRVVQSAERAQQVWQHTSAIERCKLFIACAERLEQAKQELAAITTLETGNAYRTVTSLEVEHFINLLRFYSSLGGELKGETVPLDPQMLAMTMREPLGVLAGIIPWNVPLLLMGLKIAPAIMAGNSIVIKTSEYAPFAALRAAEIINEILPPGVLSVVSGDGPDCGETLVVHPLVKKVTFTGSVINGRKVYVKAAEKLIPVTLELGGKSPMIICEDADLGQAVEGAIVGMRFIRQGQSCSASTRIFVHETLITPFLKQLGERLSTLKIGDPFASDTDAGAIICRKQYNRILRYMALAEADPDITIHRFGTLPAETEGLYLQPTILTGVAHTHRLAQEEIFGPVTCLFSWNDFDQVIEQANDTEYGLAASIWTKDLDLALAATQRLAAGLVQVNQNTVVQANLPYGGFKHSGLGQEATREAMLDHFTKRKTVLIRRQIIA